jgi:pimeloyl-ACP methyl ester carboxylesterase
MPACAAYHARRVAQSDFHAVRGLRYHVNRWGEISAIGANDNPRQPPLLMLHGWMDVGASFQFFVDELAAADGFDRLVLAPDWRGFGLTQTPAADTYWFPDYLADLDALLDQLAPGAQVDLLGHSMGGNIAMSYAGLRPQRVRRLVNLEGFGLPDAPADQAPKRLLQWLDELKAPADMRSYDSLDAVAGRLMQNNPLLSADKAAWLAPHWSALRDNDPSGRWHILGDPAHKRVNPVLYRKDEILATWQRIGAPVLWVEGAQTDITQWWGQRYPRADFEARLAVVQNVERHSLSPCGHMLHHDQPAALAGCVSAFLKRPG